MATPVVIDGLIFESQPTGGIARIYRELLQQIDPDSVQFELLLAQGKAQQIPTVKTRMIRPIDHLFKPLRLFALERYARQFAVALSKPDPRAIWHSSYFSQPPSSWQGAIVCALYDMTHEKFPTLFDGFATRQFVRHKKLCVQQAAVVACISASVRTDALEIYGGDPEKYRVIQLARSSVFQQRTINLVQRPFILYVGSRHHPYKNFGLLLDAYAQWEKHKDIDLLVVGDKATSVESNKIKNRQIPVHFLTDIDDSKLSVLYNQASAFIYPSLYEGFGIPLLEAMACGCPIVASRIPSSLEVAGDIAYFFAPDDPAALIDALDEALADGRNSQRIQAGLAHCQQYSWQKTAAETLALYQEFAI